MCIRDRGNGRTRRTLVYGVNAHLPQVFRSTVQSGQFLPADDESSARAFVVLGSKLRDELFGSENPLGPVSYTHLDVYKRQGLASAVS